MQPSVRYVYTGGAYREFRGYVFVGDKPVTGTDRGAVEALDKQPDFRREHAQNVESKAAAPTATAPPPELSEMMMKIAAPFAKKRGWPLGKKRK